MSDQPKSLAARMVAVMGDVPTMIKNGQNMAQKYAYVTAEDVKAAIRPLLKRHGIAVFSSMVDVAREMSVNKNGTPTVTVIAKMEFALVCAETGELMRCFWVGEANDYADKAVNKAATAAEKYWLINTFLLSTTEALDADEETITMTIEQQPIKITVPDVTDGRYPIEPAGRITETQKAAIREISKDVWGPTYKKDGAQHIMNGYGCTLEELSDIEAARVLEGLNRKRDEMDKATQQRAKVTP